MPGGHRFPPPARIPPCDPRCISKDGPPRAGLAINGSSDVAVNRSQGTLTPAQLAEIRPRRFARLWPLPDRGSRREPPQRELVEPEFSPTPPRSAVRQAGVGQDFQPQITSVRPRFRRKHEQIRVLVERLVVVRKRSSLLRLQLGAGFRLHLSLRLEDRPRRRRPRFPADPGAVEPVPRRAGHCRGSPRGLVRRVSGPAHTDLPRVDTGRQPPGAAQTRRAILRTLGTVGRGTRPVGRGGIPVSRASWSLARFASSSASVVSRSDDTVVLEQLRPAISASRCRRRRGGDRGVAVSPAPPRRFLRRDVDCGVVGRLPGEIGFLRLSSARNSSSPGLRGSSASRSQPPPPGARGVRRSPGLRENPAAIRWPGRSWETHPGYGVSRLVATSWPLRPAGFGGAGPSPGAITRACAARPRSAGSAASNRSNAAAASGHARREACQLARVAARAAWTPHILRVELCQRLVQPEVLGQHADAAREVGVRLQQQSQFFGGSVGVVPDDRRGGPEGGAAPSGQQVLAVGREREGMSRHPVRRCRDPAASVRAASRHSRGGPSGPCRPTPGCDHPAKTPRH